MPDLFSIVLLHHLTHCARSLSHYARYYFTKSHAPMDREFKSSSNTAALLTPVDELPELTKTGGGGLVPFNP